MERNPNDNSNSQSFDAGAGSGSTGSGSSNHLSMELFRLMTGTQIVHVPYKGSAPMVTDLLGGHVHVAFDNVPNVIQQVKAGKLRALAITSPERAASLPDVPTVKQAGGGDFEARAWNAIFGAELRA